MQLWLYQIHLPNTNFSIQSAPKKFTNLFMQPITQTYIINIVKTKLFVK